MSALWKKTSEDVLLKIKGKQREMDRKEIRFEEMNWTH